MLAKTTPMLHLLHLISPKFAEIHYPSQMLSNIKKHFPSQNNILGTFKVFWFLASLRDPFTRTHMFFDQWKIDMRYQCLECTITYSPFISKWTKACMRTHHCATLICCDLDSVIHYSFQTRIVHNLLRKGWELFSTAKSNERMSWTTWASVPLTRAFVYLNDWWCSL